MLTWSSPAAKKRRLDEVTSRPSTEVKTEAINNVEAKPSGPSRLPTSAPTAPKASLAKERPVAKPVTDMSFFGTTPSTNSKAKPKLPDIKKRDPEVKKRDFAPTPAQAGPSSSTTSLLSATFKLLKKAESPVPATPVVGPGDAVPETKTKLNKKGHAVRFRDSVPDGGELATVRLFTQAAHELEPAPWTDDVSGMSTHDMDMDEGRAMRHIEGMEEAIDWYEPERVLAAFYSRS